MIVDLFGKYTNSRKTGQDFRLRREQESYRVNMTHKLAGGDELRLFDPLGDYRVAILNTPRP
mgnify:CR=1